MNPVSSAASGINAALRLARGRPDGVVLIPDNQQAVVRSFWSILLCLPTVAIRLLMSWKDKGIPKDAVHQFSQELIIFIIGWLLFVEVTHRLAPLLGQAERWGRFIAVWNWCNVVEGLLVVIGDVPRLLGAPPVFNQASELITIGWALWLEWYATRLALGVGATAATWLVLLDQMIGVLLASIAVSLTS